MRIARSVATHSHNSKTIVEGSDGAPTTYETSSPANAHASVSNGALGRLSVTVTVRYDRDKNAYVASVPGARGGDTLTKEAVTPSAAASLVWGAAIERRRGEFGET